MASSSENPQSLRYVRLLFTKPNIKLLTVTAAAWYSDLFSFEIICTLFPKDKNSCSNFP